MEGISLASLFPRSDDHRLYSWYNISTPAYNGTEVEGNQSLDFSDFFFQQIVANNIAVAALTLYIWEYISTIFDEINLYRYHKVLSHHVILFILVRYGTLPSLILPAYSVWHDFSQDGQGCLAHQQLAICVVQLIVSIVFAWRAVAIWNRTLKITIFFVVLVCVQFGASFALLWFSEQKLLPNGTCMAVTPLHGWNPLPAFYAIAFAFEVLTIGMSTYKLWQISSLGRAEQPSDSAHWTQVVTSPKLLWTRLKIHSRAMSSSPLIARLTRSGLVYLVAASAYNAVSFSLEVGKDIHSKALITLYAPLMSVLCQRLILMDVSAIWGGTDKRSDGSREQALIDRVMAERRLSWQGSDADPIDSSTESPLGEKQGQHIAVDMNGNSSSKEGRMLGFQDMLSQVPPPQQSKFSHWRMNRRKDRGDLSDDSTLSPSPPPSTSSSQQPLHPPASSMSSDNKALALRMAGLEQQTTPSDEESSL